MLYIIFGKPRDLTIVILLCNQLRYVSFVPNNSNTKQFFLFWGISLPHFARNWMKWKCPSNLRSSILLISSSLAADCNFYTVAYDTIPAKFLLKHSKVFCCYPIKKQSEQSGVRNDTRHNQLFSYFCLNMVLGDMYLSHAPPPQRRRKCAIILENISAQFKPFWFCHLQLI